MENREPYLASLEPMERFVLQLSRREFQPNEWELHPEVLDAPGAVDSFKEMAIRHGVRGLVLTNLRKLPWKDVAQRPNIEEILRALPSLQKHSTLWELEQERVLSSLADRGLTPLVLKGGALRHSAYEAPVERLMGDLDVLATSEEVPEYLEALKKLGYGSEYSEEARRGFRDFHYHERVTHPNGFIVEVHWGLTREARPCHLDHAWFFRRARTLETAWGTPMLVPSPEDMLLHLVSQTEQEGFAKLSRIVDIDRVVAASKGLDWEYVLARGGEGNLTGALSISARLANLLLLTPAPLVLLDGTRLDRAARRAIEFLRPIQFLIRTRGLDRVAAYDLFHLWSLPGWRLRIEAFSKILTGNQDPLLWVWEKTERPEGNQPRWGHGMARTSKLLGFQAWIGVLGLAGTMFPTQRHGLRFWERPPGGRENGGVY